MLGLCLRRVGGNGDRKKSCRLQANALKKEVKCTKNRSVQPEEYEFTE